MSCPVGAAQSALERRNRHSGIASHYCAWPTLQSYMVTYALPLLLLLLLLLHTTS